MAEGVPNAQQEFWRSPVALDPVSEPVLPAAAESLAEACAGCETEFMIGAKFCHKCGSHRAVAELEKASITGPWARNMANVRAWPGAVVNVWRTIPFPSWMHYLHFHEIQRLVGLPTASLVAFMIGLGCVTGAVGVSLFYKAANLAEFQAIQMWRIEWLLGATTAFTAGILLKKPSNHDNE